MTEFLALPRTQQEKVLEVFQSILLQFPHRETEGSNNEDVVGNYLLNCKNARHCFDSTDLQDCANCFNVRGARDCQDIDRWGDPSELCYDCLGIGQRMLNTAFTYCCWNGCTNLFYGMYCHKTSDCFGCVGLQRGRYCILNKQYTKEEYESLVPRLIEHMRKDGGGAMNPSGVSGSWGEYLPIKTSYFGYNETVADEFYPLTREEILQRGWKWNTDHDRENYLGPQYEIPEKIQDVTNEICDHILVCESTGKPYKIIPQELEFYRAHGLPIPKECPDARYRNRVMLRNPRKLWKRDCAKCSKNIQTTYAPERPKIVYCEDCYLQTVY